MSKAALSVDQIGCSPSELIAVLEGRFPMRSCWRLTVFPSNNAVWMRVRIPRRDALVDLKGMVDGIRSGRLQVIDTTGRQLEQ